MSRPIGDLHPLPQSNIMDTSRSLAEQLQASCELKPAYRYLACAAIGNIVNATFAMTDNQPTSRSLRLVDASAAGIGTMVRFLSLLPDIYESQRNEFGNKPEHTQQQVLELGSIAMRSSLHSAILAGQSAQIAGVIERNDYLRGMRENKRYEEYKTINHYYTLKNTNAGLEILPRFDLESRLSRLAQRYTSEVANHRNLERAPGCLAHAAPATEGGTVFDKIWETFVDTAINDPRFFYNDFVELNNMNRYEDSSDLIWR
jgi:hypothetical protein